MSLRNLVPFNERGLWELIFTGQTKRARQLIADYRKQLIDNELALDASRSRQSSLANAVLFDSSLHSNKGHQLYIAKDYEELFQSLDYQLHIEHAAQHTLDQQENWSGYFLTPHHTLSFRPIQTLEELRNVNNYFYSQYAVLLKELMPTVCVFSTARFCTILGAVKAVVESEMNVYPKVIFTVFESNDAPDCDDPDLSDWAFSKAATLLHEHKIEYRVSVETPYLRQYLLGCGFNAESVNIYEYVSARRIGTRRVEKNSSVTGSKLDTVRVGYVGGSRPTRKPELIADLIVAQLNRTNIRWCVQLDLNYIRNVRGQDYVSQLRTLQAQEAIELYLPGLSDIEYQELFNSLDIVILPYAERYQRIGSGVLSEAIYAEVIPVIPYNSTMSSLYTSLGGEAPSFQNAAVNDIASVLDYAVSQLQSLKQTAKGVRRKWVTHPSSYQQWRSNLTDWIAG